MSSPMRMRTHWTRIWTTSKKEEIQVTVFHITNRHSKVMDIPRLRRRTLLSQSHHGSLQPAFQCLRLRTPSDLHPQKIHSYSIPKESSLTPSSQNPSKKPFPTHNWTPQVDEWILERNIGHYKVGESFQTSRRDPIPEDTTYRAILVLVLRVAPYEDCIH